jgi:hypothetical protein
MTCSLTLSSTDVAAGRIAARRRARMAHLRAGSCAVAGAHVDGFASMLLVVLPMRSAEKSKFPTESIVLLCYRWNRNLFFSCRKRHGKLARADAAMQIPGNALSPALSLFAALLVLTGRGEGISPLRYHQCKCGNSTWQWVCPTVEKGRSNMH